MKKENSINFHKKHHGIIKTEIMAPCKNKEDLSMLYTPGVSCVCTEIYKNPKKFYDLTWSGNTIAIVSDGSRVLGLGNIGPKAAMPVMEGKAYLFKKFGNLNAVPICTNQMSADEMIDLIKKISPSFAAINLEDIENPKCFEIEKRLKEELDIPIMHDDQDGTAIITLAGLINALKLVKKNIENIKIVINGAGAAGYSIAKLIKKAGAKKIYILDSKETINSKRTDLKKHKKELLNFCIDEKKDLETALIDADVFIGVSRPNILKKKYIEKMKNDPIIFALCNPIPEISEKKIKKTKAKIYATGRSDLPNQINNALVFPGLFSAIVKYKIKKITEEIKLETAYAISNVIKKKQLNKNYIVPDIFDKKVVINIHKYLKKFKK